MAHDVLFGDHAFLTGGRHRLPLSVLSCIALRFSRTLRFFRRSRLNRIRHWSNRSVRPPGNGHIGTPRKTLWRKACIASLIRHRPYYVKYVERQGIKAY